ncbi:hypothetical protein KIN20_009244 [Parelaphostrongylus tenuis]|uniref:Uncharacterized protein n=1 Tax=Parelaphostrongylus tenuis TaxID=148309 RepID=A0AAD5QN99_PARTN|nr:hypothetical protein KIN20_009244 [Parelaphostrongylus tenuis]
MTENDDVIFIGEYPSAGLIRRRDSPLSVIQAHSDPNSSGSGSEAPTSSKRDLGSSNSECSEFNRYERLHSEAKSTSEECHAPAVSSLEVDDDAVQQDPPVLAENACSEEKRTKKPRKRAPCHAQLLRQREKKRRAIEREIKASLNSKCEQYMFCSVSRRIFYEFPETELHTRSIFSERNISSQLICDEERNDMKVLWHRKCIEAVEEGDDVLRNEYNVQQHVFAVVLSTESLRELLKAKSLEDFVTMEKLSYPVANSSLILIVFGKNSRQVFVQALFFEQVDYYSFIFSILSCCHVFSFIVFFLIHFFISASFFLRCIICLL